MKYALVTILLLFMAPAIYADVVVIGPGVRNGDFESGVDAPWLDCTVVSNADFAAQGNCYAYTHPDVWRAGIFQFFPAVSTSMPNFTLTYQLRNGPPPYTEFQYGLNARRQDGSWFTASRVYRLNPPPTNDAWCKHEYVFVFDEPWAESYDMQLHIGWNGGETNSIGYLDDVCLTQISDPTSIREMTISNGVVQLSVQQLAPSNTYSIQRSSNLVGDNWLSVSNLILAYPGIEWSEELSNQLDKVFYRLKQE